MDITPQELERLEDQCREAGVYNEFAELVDLGNNPRFAAMLALQEPPGTRFTDKAFCQGQRRKMENMSPILAKKLHGMAKQAGIDTAGKYYLGGLADRGKGPTDPAAWVTCADDVLTVAKKKNLNIEGVLNHKAVTKERPQQEPGLAPDIVNQLERSAFLKDPALRERCKNKRVRQEFRESLVEKHGPKKRVKKPRRLVR